MYCNQCGYNIGDNAKFCPACGCKVLPQNQNQGTEITTYFENAPASKPGDEGSTFWWGVLCLILPPIVGFVLYFVWREKFPKRAKTCLWCAIVSVVLYIILTPYLEEEMSRLVSSLCLSFL